jgi:hypothetical protein
MKMLSEHFQLARDFDMMPQNSQPRLIARRWLKAVTIVMGVLVGLTVAMTSASALQSASEGHSCCCEPSSTETPKDEASTHDGCQHQKAKAEQATKPCQMTAPAEGCQCHIDSDDNAPAGDTVALGAGTYSFAPAVAATLHPQLDIPLARAPSAVSSDWLYGHSPPEPLYLLHQTFLN